LDSISEEINNSIFRKGHVNVGLSSALIGSGMAFEAKWFISKVEQLCTSGEDKELETLLLKDRIHIGYLPEVNIYDEKTQKSSNFYNQRRRWIATQFFSFFRSTKEFFPALLHGNIDYIDKLIQWTLLPRIILLGFTSIFALIASFTKLPFFYKWWGLLGIIIITFCISIPKKHWDKKLFRAIIQVPLLFALMVANLFRIKGANKTFIHTEKNYENSN
jgi:cellulose synthase/poly-beta-1,6-N-acetylglucosamine synthase-like glycosyltransferase